MEDELKRLPVAFYRSASEAEPVREWLMELTDADRRIVGYDIGTSNLDGRLACLCVGRLAAAFGRSEARLAAIGSPE
jgi:hypothetical protein